MSNKFKNFSFNIFEFYFYVSEFKCLDVFFTDFNKTFIPFIYEIKM